MCYPLGSFSGPPEKRDYLENFHPGSWHHNTGILANQAGSFVIRNREVDFCCVSLRCRDLCKAGQSSSCNQAISSTARFYALSLDLTDFLKPPEHTQNVSAPKHLYRRPNIRSHSVSFFMQYVTKTPFPGLFCLKRKEEEVLNFWPKLWTNPLEKRKFCDFLKSIPEKIDFIDALSVWTGNASLG